MTLFKPGDRVKYVGTGDEQLRTYEGKLGTVDCHQSEDHPKPEVIVIFDEDSEAFWVDVPNLQKCP